MLDNNLYVRDARQQLIEPQAPAHETSRIGNIEQLGLSQNRIGNHSLTAWLVWLGFQKKLADRSAPLLFPMLLESLEMIVGPYGRVQFLWASPQPLVLISMNIVQLSSFQMFP